MWTALPTELVLHIGTFVQHRDARCMQASCVDWGRVWTSAGLLCPHPAIQFIDLCTVGHCINRNYVLRAIEPFLAPGKTGTLSYHVLRFMVFLFPVRFLASVGRLIQLEALEHRCMHLEKTLVFWCACTVVHEHKVHQPSLQPVGPTPRRFLKQSLCIETVGVWCALLLFLAIPTTVAVTISVGILGCVYLSGSFLAREMIY
jgi:hypothetical protein